jgi:hypothetical protein
MIVRRFGAVVDRCEKWQRNEDQMHARVDAG